MTYLIEEFPEELHAQNAKQPWNQELFDRDPESASFTNDAAAIIHTFVAKGLFVTKRARPDIRPAIAFLTTRVSIEIVLTLAMDDITVITWHLDASFAVHDNMRSHTGAVMSLGKGSIHCQSVLCKQKINTLSSTEAELVSFDDLFGETDVDQTVPRSSRLRGDGKCCVSRQSEFHEIRDKWQGQSWQEN